MLLQHGWCPRQTMVPNSGYRALCCGGASCNVYVVFSSNGLVSNGGFRFPSNIPWGIKRWRHLRINWFAIWCWARRSNHKSRCSRSQLASIRDWSVPLKTSILTKKLGNCTAEKTSLTWALVVRVTPNILYPYTKFWVSNIRSIVVSQT